MRVCSSRLGDTDLDGTDALITVTGAAATAVELASGSNIALYGSGFDLEAGKTIQLIKSDKGIEKDGNAAWLRVILWTILRVTLP